LKKIVRKNPGMRPRRQRAVDLAQRMQAKALRCIGRREDHSKIEQE
jgi:hypothetical protein